MFIVITLLSLSVLNNQNVVLTMSGTYKKLGQNSGVSFPHKNKEQCSHK